MRGVRSGRLVVLVTAALVAGMTAGSGGTSAVAGGQPTGGARDATAGGRVGSVVIRSVTVAVPHQQPVSAYLVRPGGRQQPHSDAGILFLHWLGQVRGDRSEYLAEATELAGRGVISLLPQGYFPWVPNPDGTTHDVRLVKRQVKAFRAALDRLAGLRAVDASRIAVVGHDYGAMYGTLVAARDHRVAALVLEAPDSTWGNWFAKYWLGLEGAERTAYLALFNGLDPVDHTRRLGRHVLFQWAGQDVFVSPEVRAAFAANNPHARVLLYDSSDHQLTDAAQVDRDAFIAHQLGLPVQ